MNNWLFLLLGLILGMIPGYFVNLTTPWVRSYFEKGSLSLRDRRIKAILEEFDQIKSWRENPGRVTILGFFSVSVGLLEFVVLALLLALDIMYLPRTIIVSGFTLSFSSSGAMLGFVTAGWLGALMGGQLGFMRTMYNLLRSFDYDAQVINKLRQLGYNVDEIEKEFIKQIDVYELDETGQRVLVSHYGKKVRSRNSHSPR